MITHARKIDMYPASVPVVVHLSQYDDDFTLEFTMFSSVGEFTVETGTTAKIRGTKKDGKGYSANATINTTQKKVTVTGNQQMTAIAGRNVYELVLTRNTKVLSTANFILEVEPAAMDANTVESKSVIQEIGESVNEYLDEHPEMVYQVDDTLSVTGAAADAKKTGDEIADLKSDLKQKTGLSEDAKIALLDCFEHVAWIDEHGQTYYDSLYDALYPDTGLVRITAVFEQDSLTVYPETPLNDLKPYLTVTGYYKDGSTARIGDYALSGTLTVGTSTVTVSKDGKTATFSVTVAQSPLIYKIDSGTDLTGQTFDTGVNAFGIEQDFTVLAKITLFADTSEPSSTTKMKMLVTNGSIGNKNVFRLAIDVKDGLNYYVTNYMYGDSYASIAGQYANVQHELIWVCRNENAQFRKVLYVDGTLALDKEEDMTLKTTGTVSGTYVIGSSPISAEVGVFNIYNVALDYSDINTILGIDLQG